MDIKELIGGILFMGLFFGLIAATAITEPLNQTITELKGE